MISRKLGSFNLIPKYPLPRWSLFTAPQKRMMHIGALGSVIYCWHTISCFLKYLQKKKIHFRAVQPKSAKTRSTVFCEPLSFFAYLHLWKSKKRYGSAYLSVRFFLFHHGNEPGQIWRETIRICFSRFVKNLLLFKHFQDRIMVLIMRQEGGKHPLPAILQVPFFFVAPSLRCVSSSCFFGYGIRH